MPSDTDCICCSGDKIAVDQLGDGTIILKKIEEQETLAAAERSEIGIMQAAHS